ncbi:porin family protein [Maribacter sp. 2308TA10-17]|uniref:porin family protein n=1 Tax=Maribacter sp. 2308TA10-17 TaxID=3386276 RepID=UPI0039BD571D
MKNYSIFFVFILFSSIAFAQTKKSFGLRLGINYSNISNTGLDARIAGNGAFFFEARFSDKYALQPELMFSSQGGKASNATNEDLRIDYLSIGLANKFFIIPNAGLHLLAGPSFDIDFENNPIKLINGNNDSNVTPFDLSVFAGIGYEFPFGLILEARYKQGLIEIDLFDFDIFSDSTDRNRDEAFNGTFQYSIAYKF